MEVRHQGRGVHRDQAQGEPEDSGGLQERGEKRGVRALQDRQQGEGAGVGMAERQAAIQVSHDFQQLIHSIILFLLLLELLHHPHANGVLVLLHHLHLLLLLLLVLLGDAVGQQLPRLLLLGLLLGLLLAILLLVYYVLLLQLLILGQQVLLHRLRVVSQ